MGGSIWNKNDRILSHVEAGWWVHGSSLCYSVWGFVLISIKVTTKQNFEVLIKNKLNESRCFVVPHHHQEKLL